LKKKNLTIYMNFITNFRPINTNINSNFFFRIKTKNRIMSRNFILFLLLITYLKNNNFFLNFSFFVKPFFKKSNIILRAPYKNKLSRHHLAYNRYNLLIKFNFNFESLITITKLRDLIFLKKKIKSFFFCDSNLIFVINIKLKLYLILIL